MDRSSILRASTINATTWENSQVVLFCQQNRQGESNSACIARVTKRASGAFRRARARRADASKPRGCAQRIRWFDSPRLHHQFRASLTRGSFASRAENRRSQNQLRALRAKNNSQDCFYGAARRRANPRASTINTTTWENSQVVLFCKHGCQGESNSASHHMFPHDKIPLILILSRI